MKYKILIDGEAPSVAKFGEYAKKETDDFDEGQSIVRKIVEHLEIEYEDTDEQKIINVSLIDTTIPVENRDRLVHVGLVNTFDDTAEAEGGDAEIYSHVN